MELWVLFGSFVILLLIGTPVAFCLGVSSFATILYMGLPPVVVFQRLNSGVSVFALMAIPFFIFAGELMVRGDIARRLVALAGSLVGHFRGGLGQVNIAASVLFGGVSGSAAADASAIGGLMIPQMKARGYDVDFAVNITVVGSVIALMIPPSHNLIIYSISAGGQDLDRRPLHRRHHPGPPARRLPDGRRPLCGAAPRLPHRGLPRLGDGRPALRYRRSRPDPDPDHLRRRPLRRLHRLGKLLHRRGLRAPRHRLRLSHACTGASSSRQR